jgi:hypothetical protein
MSTYHTAKVLSSSVSHVVVRGKLGKIKKQPNATKTVAAPSMINSHCQAPRPRAPSMPHVTPADMRPEKAPDISAPEYKTAVRKPSSLRVYQHER